MEKIAHPKTDFTPAAWADVGWQPKELKRAPIGTMKMSEAVRQAGYEDYGNSKECVVARAYRYATGQVLIDVLATREDMGLSAGRELRNLRKRPFLSVPAELFGIPVSVVDRAEDMCSEHVPASEIADWLEAQGY